MLLCIIALFLQTKNRRGRVTREAQPDPQTVPLLLLAASYCPAGVGPTGGDLLRRGAGRRRGVHHVAADRVALRPRGARAGGRDQVLPLHERHRPVPEVPHLPAERDDRELDLPHARAGVVVVPHRRELGERHVVLEGHGAAVPDVQLGRAALAQEVVHGRAGLAEPVQVHGGLGHVADRELHRERQVVGGLPDDRVERVVPDDGVEAHAHDRADDAAHDHAGEPVALAHPDDAREHAERDEQQVHDDGPPPGALGLGLEHPTAAVVHAEAVHQQEGVVPGVVRQRSRGLHLLDQLGPLDAPGEPPAVRVHAHLQAHLVGLGQEDGVLDAVEGRDDALVHRLVVQPVHLGADRHEVRLARELAVGLRVPRGVADHDGGLARAGGVVLAVLGLVDQCAAEGQEPGEREGQQDAAVDGAVQQHAEHADRGGADEHDRQVVAPLVPEPVLQHGRVVHPGRTHEPGHEAQDPGEQHVRHDVAEAGALAATVGDPGGDERDAEPQAPEDHGADRHAGPRVEVLCEHVEEERDASQAGADSDQEISQCVVHSSSPATGELASPPVDHEVLVQLPRLPKMSRRIRPAMPIAYAAVASTPASVMRSVSRWSWTSESTMPTNSRRPVRPRSRSDSWKCVEDTAFRPSSPPKLAGTISEESM